MPSPRIDRNHEARAQSSESNRVFRHRVETRNGWNRATVGRAAKRRFRPSPKQDRRRERHCRELPNTSAASHRSKQICDIAHRQAIAPPRSLKLAFTNAIVHAARTLTRERVQRSVKLQEKFMDLFEEIVKMRRAGRRAALATIVHTNGSIPSYESSRMLVREDGSIAGTIGGGCVEAEVWAAA